MHESELIDASVSSTKITNSSTSIEPPDYIVTMKTNEGSIPSTEDNPTMN